MTFRRWLETFCLLAAVASSACSDAGEQGGEGPIEAIEQDLGTWDFYGNHIGFDMRDGMLCASYPRPNGSGGVFYDAVTCFLATPTGRSPTGPGAGFYVNWGAGGNNVIPGGNVKAVAVSSAFRTDAVVYILGSDNKVRISQGHLSKNTGATWYTGTNFKTVSEYLPASDSSGAALCLKQLAMITLPSRYAPARDLIGLSCGGAVYVVRNRTWTKAASAGLPWSALPSATWSTISHGPVGAYLMSSTLQVLLIGTGTADITGGVTYTPPSWLSMRDISRNRTLVNVGGAFALFKENGVSCPVLLCTDSGAVRRWNGSTYAPAPKPIETGSGGPFPWGGIVDGSSFRNDVNTFGLDHDDSSRVYVWNP
ncbi:MAG TPA: hypothetical protein VIM73_01625 [Polyangiaceae bacterium]